MKKKNLLTRAIIIAIVTIGGLYLVIGPRHRPSLKDFTWSGIKQTLAKNIHLGLDLQGGSHLVMRVKTEEFLKRLTEEDFVAAQNAAKDAGFETKGGRADTNPGNYRVVLQIADASKANDVKEAVQKKILTGWEEQDYKRVRDAMVNHLLAINLSMLEMPVQERYQRAFQLGWKQLDGRDDQTQVAEQTAVTVKKSLRDFLENQP